jgi:hypothetical protein
MPLYNIKIKPVFALIILAIINALFTYKYGARFNQHPFIITVLYSLIFLGIPFFMGLIPAKLVKMPVVYVMIGLYCAADIYYFSTTDPMKLNVDRWSVITSFWDFLLSGKFPYLAKSHMGNAPGPFPFYFLLALPFYLIHQIGYLSLVGWLLTLLYMLRNKNASVNTRTAVVFLALISTSLIWELTTRSTMLINGILVFMYTDFLLKRKSFSNKDLIIAGIAGGLLLSTRSLAVIPYIMVFTFLFLKEKKWKELFTIGLIIVSTFLLTLVPFILWDYRLFMKYNPITLQGSFLPDIILVGYMIACFIAGLLIKSKESINFFCGLMLFGVVAIYFIDKGITVGPAAYMDNIIDISYFIFAMPYLFASVLQWGAKEVHKPPTLFGG